MLAKRRSGLVVVSRLIEPLLIPAAASCGWRNKRSLLWLAPVIAACLAASAAALLPLNRGPCRAPEEKGLEPAWQGRSPTSALGLAFGFLGGSGRCRDVATAHGHFGDLAAHALDQPHGLVQPGVGNLHDAVRAAHEVIVGHPGDTDGDLAAVAEAGASGACRDLHGVDAVCGVRESGEAAQLMGVRLAMRPPWRCTRCCTSSNLLKSTNSTWLLRLRRLPGVNYVGGSRQLPRRVPPGSSPCHGRGRRQRK